MTRFFCANETPAPGHWCLFGAPVEATTCFRKGTCEGPRGIRDVSDGLEDYDPISKRSLEDVPFGDIGDCKTSDSLMDSLFNVADMVDRVLKLDARPLMIGGEHSVTPAVVHRLVRHHPDLVVVQFDAHADLRDGYEGEKWSHACAMRRCLDVISPSNLYQVGIRSGTRDEYGFMDQHGTLIPLEQLSQKVQEFGDLPVYVTVDIDVLDPSVMPGTGTPEPGGWSFQQLDTALRTLVQARWVGADVVETAPNLDPSGISAITAAKILRTILLSA